MFSFTNERIDLLMAVDVDKLVDVLIVWIQMLRESFLLLHFLCVKENESCLLFRRQSCRSRSSIPGTCGRDLSSGLA